MSATPARYQRLTPDEAWTLFLHVRSDTYLANELEEIHRQHATWLRHYTRIGRPFTASELLCKLRHHGVDGVSGILERALWAGILTYNGLRGRERLYTRVK